MLHMDDIMIITFGGFPPLIALFAAVLSSLALTLQSSMP